MMPSPHAPVALVLLGCASQVIPAAGDSGNHGADGAYTGADSAAATYTTAWGSAMIPIGAGAFEMASGGSDANGAYEDHHVTLTHEFWIGATEVTRGQWEWSSANDGWEYSSTPDLPCTTSTTTGDCPADTVSWFDGARYANALSAEEGLSPCYLADGTDYAAGYFGDPYNCPGYRRPTEAEWEYAARAGADTIHAGSDTAADVAWSLENAYDQGTYAHQVATLAPNAWGLYDMTGNVWEWTNDWYHVGYGGYGDGSPQVDPIGPGSGTTRVLRGGSWANYSASCTVVFRATDTPESSSYHIGFRLTRSVVP